MAKYFVEWISDILPESQNANLYSLAERYTSVPFNYIKGTFASAARESNTTVNIHSISLKINPSKCCDSPNSKFVKTRIKQKDNFDEIKRNAAFIKRSVDASFEIIQTIYLKF